MSDQTIIITKIEYNASRQEFDIYLNNNTYMTYPVEHIENWKNSPIYNSSKDNCRYPVGFNETSKKHIVDAEFYYHGDTLSATLRFRFSDGEYFVIPAGQIRNYKPTVVINDPMLETENKKLYSENLFWKGCVGFLVICYLLAIFSK